MPRGPALRQADVARALAALKAAGLEAAAVDVLPGGGLRIHPRPVGAPADPPLTIQPPGAKPANLDDFRAGRAARRGDRAA